MKKAMMVFLCFLVMLTMSGCEETKKSEQLVCTTKETEDGMDISQVVSMTYQDDRLKSMKLEISTKITDPTVQENWEAFKAYMDEQNEAFEKEGVRFQISKNDQTYEYNTILDIDVENASEEVLEEQGFSGLKDDQDTLESSKEAAEKDGTICEIK